MLIGEIDTQEWDDLHGRMKFATRPSVIGLIAARAMEASIKRNYSERWEKVIGLPSESADWDTRERSIRPAPASRSRPRVRAEIHAASSS